MNDGKKNNVLREFFGLCRKPKFKKVVKVLLAGRIGGAIHEWMFGDDLEKLIELLHKESETRQDEIIKMLEELMALRTDARKPIIAIGSGYGEIIVESHDEITLGNKHTIRLHNLIGGSGLNFALRLMASNNLSLPILPIGNDKVGRDIRQEVVKAMVRANAPELIKTYVHSDYFLNSSIKTPTSIILTNISDRTVFVQELCGAEHFQAQLENQLDLIDALFDGQPGPIMIGHIQSDSTEGRSTRTIIDRYRNRSLIYTVFGNSQIGHGWEFWDEKDTFKEIDIFQLNFEEAQRFLSRNGERKSLREILEWFRKRKLTAVLTMRKFGAIGTFKDLDCLFIAYPLIAADEVADTTGSGDAFAAGMVSYLRDKKGFDDVDFCKAMQRGRIWASCACKSAGGIGKEPGKELDKFMREHPDCERSPVEMRETSHAEEMIKFIDLAHQ